MTSRFADAEREIGTLLAEGDSARGVTRAIGLFGPEILGFLESFHRNPDDAQEVFARLCERMWKGVSKFRGASTFRTWMYSIAINESRRLRARVARQRSPVRITASDLPAPAARSATPRYMQTGPKTELRTLREKLSENDQLLLILRVDRDLSWEEVARALAEEQDADPSPREIAALRKRFERLKDKLKSEAEKAGLWKDRA